MRFVFGFEEALGFSVDEVVRDKDGISAALRFAELAAVAEADGASIWDGLERLARRFGEHATRTWSMRAEGADGLARIASAMADAAGRPARAASAASAVVPGHRSGGRVGWRTRRPMRSSSSWTTGSRVCVRPSGTEPKLKVYVEVVEPVGDGAGAYAAARVDGARRVDALIDAFAPLLGLAAP